MAMTATLAVTSGPVIAGQPGDLNLVVSNSGASDVTVTTISLRVSPNTVPVVFSQWAPTIGQVVTVTASGSLNIPMSFCFLGPNYPGSTGEAPDDCLVSADILTSDGSLFSPIAIDLAAATPTDIVDPVGDSGGLRFNSGYNSGNFVWVFP